MLCCKLCGVKRCSGFCLGIGLSSTIARMRSPSSCVLVVTQSRCLTQTGTDCFAALLPENWDAPACQPVQPGRAGARNFPSSLPSSSTNPSTFPHGPITPAQPGNFRPFGSNLLAGRSPALLHTSSKYRSSRPICAGSSRGSFPADIDSGVRCNSRRASAQSQHL
jgi:hypothetical protein